MERKSLLNPSHVDWEDHTGHYPNLMNCNFYVGCAHDCSYCYAKKMSRRKTSWTDVETVDNAVQLAKRQTPNIKYARIMFCSMTDPYQPTEPETHLARDILKILLNNTKILVLIITKSHLVLHDYDILQHKKNVEVGFTITSLMDVERERRAPGNSLRIAALKIASKFDISTFVSIEPWIPGITDPIEIMEELGPFVDRWILGTLNHQKVNYRHYQQAMSKLLEYIQSNQLQVQFKRELYPLVPVYLRKTISVSKKGGQQRLFKRRYG